MKSFTLKSISLSILSVVTFSTTAELYEIQEVQVADNFRSSFARDINNEELIVGTSRFPLDVEFDVDYLPVTILTRQFGIDDVRELDSFTQEQYDFLVERLALENNNNPATQLVGIYQSYFYDGLTETINVFPPADNELQSSSESQFYSINNNHVAVGYGTAPFRSIDHTYTTEDEEVTDTYFVRDFISRGVWYRDGELQVIEPPFTDVLGGESAILDINDNGLAVGYASIALSPFGETSIDECRPEEDEEAIRPVEVCAWGVWFDLQNESPFGGYAAKRSIYDIRGYLWQFDTNGEVIEQTELGTLEERQEDDERDFSSSALAVNDNGIAVGQSWTYYGSQTSIKMPAIFANGDAKPVTDSEEFYWGAATDVNNNNRAVGYLAQRISGAYRNTAFYYDIDEGHLQLLPGFFTGSSTRVNGINNNDVVVGTGEIEATLSQVRKRVGFMFDTTDDTAEFINLNDAVSCDSPYDIVEANSINDNGVILATALKQEEYQDESGETQTRDVAVTIKLDPVDGELNNCRQEENQIEREGASTGLFSLLTLGSLGLLITAIRRRAFLKTKKS